MEAALSQLAQAGRWLKQPPRKPAQALARYPTQKALLEQALTGLKQSACYFPPRQEWR
jgi:hypothetical protein